MVAGNIVPLPTTTTAAKRRDDIALRLRWLDQVAADPEVTDFTLRVAYQIQWHLNQQTLVAIIGRETLAAKSHRTVRGVEKSIQRLDRLGHLEVIKAPIGSRIDDSPVHGGYGGTNTYRLLLNRANGGSEKGEPPFQEGRTTIRPYPCIYPGDIPSQRADARERELFDQLIASWPSASINVDEAWRLFGTLSVDDQAEAVELQAQWVAHVTMKEKRTVLQSICTYLRGRLWKRIRPAAEKPRPVILLAPDDPGWNSAAAKYEAAKGVAPKPIRHKDGRYGFYFAIEMVNEGAEAE